MSELLNLIGLSTGVALYAMLLTMVVRANHAASARRFDPVLLSTALLGLVWNLCALPAYELPKVGVAGPFPWLVAVGFSALGFLPAAVVHSVLRQGPTGIQGAVRRLLATTAYAVSAAALLLQFQAAGSGSPVPSPLAMQMLTYTFVALVFPLAVVTRGQHGSRRALWIAALATFAVSALHLSQSHRGEASWPIELLGHHASVPLAFAMLYQDYPFALADLFLKRALALMLLVATSFVVIALFATSSAAFARFVQMDPRQIGALVTVWIGTALVYPTLRRGAFWFVDVVVLHRSDYRSLRASVVARLQASESTSDVMSGVCEMLATALHARSVTWHVSSTLEDEAIGSAVVAVPTAEEPRPVMVVSGLMGGRRLLSDDTATLETVGLLVARRIDALRITRERTDRQLREQELDKLSTEAELRALRAQINPHFLFNALTTIGYLIQTAPTRALETLMRLTSLLRGVLRSEGEFTTLGRELELVESYLDIERARFEDRLIVRIDVADQLKTMRVPPLVLQPLVENAVKHGVGPLREGGEVIVTARLQPPAEHGTARLVLTVRDTGVGTTAATLAARRRDGVGLRNVERRLACQYGEAASVAVDTALGRGMAVTIVLPVEFMAREEPGRRAV
jgi:two-component system, LytTR family, sensor kinase